MSSLCPLVIAHNFFVFQELIELYPQLLIEIFAFSGSQTFGLNKYEPRRYSYDFNAALNFLSTNGCLFKVINKLMADQDAEFHFPYKGLPVSFNFVYILYYSILYLIYNFFFSF